MRVVELGARCDLVSGERDAASPSGLSFKVSEYAALDDGRRITLHAERGWTQWPRRAVPAGEPLPADWGDPIDPWEHTSREDIVQCTLHVVLPDDDDHPDDHPYEWLAGLLAKHGISATVEELRALPYAVELSPALEARLDERQ